MADFFANHKLAIITVSTGFGVGLFGTLIEPKEKDTKTKDIIKRGTIAGTGVALFEFLISRVIPNGWIKEIIRINVMCYLIYGTCGLARVVNWCCKKKKKVTID